MNLKQLILRTLTCTIIMTATASWVRADDLRNVKHGETFPEYKLPAIDGTIIDSAAARGSVVVITCLSAEQRRSELVATESMQVVKALTADGVQLLHVTADAVQKPYFEKLRQENSITSPLAFDVDRTLYGRLGIIAFPTTIILNKEGKLDSVVLLHSSDYKRVLEAHIRHALGTLSDKDLAEQLAPRQTDAGSPKLASAAHRSLARLMRERGEFDSARKELNKAIEIDPANQEVMLDLADLDIAANNLDAADAMLEKILAAQPDHRRAKLLKGISLYHRGKLDEAKTILQDSIPLNPSPELAHYYLGRIFEQKGDKDQALAQYRDALKLFVHETKPPPAPAPSSPTPPAK